MSDAKGKLYLVPTPIGNLGDISQRALATLQQADLVACEDTRVSGALLKRFSIQKRLISYHNFNEMGRARQLLEELQTGKSVAVITDAGSPGISDPAYRVVRTALDHDIEIVALPGPSALIPALTASGLPTDRFFFEGFLPVKGAARRNRLKVLKSFEHTLVFYESPHRINKAVADMHEVLGDRRACLAREISKKFEEYLRGRLGELAEMLSKRTIKGEIVLVVEGLGKGHPEAGDEEAGI
ncbi:MAG: 16S rRNA (cytidine(1402)-2'-O)-methyltransferase [Candidatus Zixiibacteriota bacterium]